MAPQFGRTRPLQSINSPNCRYPRRLRRPEDLQRDTLLVLPVAGCQQHDRKQSENRDVDRRAGALACAWGRAWRPPLSHIRGGRALINTRKAVRRTSPQSPKFLASIEHAAGQFTATYEVHRLSWIDTGRHGPCATFQAAELWLEGEARKLKLPVVWHRHSYRPDPPPG